MRETVQVKVFTLHREPTASSFSYFAPASPSQWALLIEYYENNELDSEEIVEVAWNFDRYPYPEFWIAPFGNKKRKEFESAPGFKRVVVHTTDFLNLPADYFVSRFCDSIIQKQKNFKSLNCHTLLKEFLSKASIETSLVAETAKSAAKFSAKVWTFGLMF